MPENQIDLAHLFGQVAKTLMENKASLNKADTQNKDHGDNMVEIFKMITLAMEEKSGSSPADQLEYAARLLRRKESGSARLYEQGLLQAAKDFAGKNGVSPANAMQLVQDLLGGGQAAMTQSSGDPLSSILTRLMGGADQSATSGEIDPEDLINAGLAFLNAKQSGKNNMDALVDAVVSSSAMAGTPHRTQSGELVMNTLLDVISKMSK